MDSDWTIGQFFLGMVFAAIGFVIVWKADWMLRNFGRVPFAEKFLTTEGGTRLFYKLIGILIMVGGMMHATGLLAPTITYFVERLFSGYTRGDAV